MKPFTLMFIVLVLLLFIVSVMFYVAGTLAGGSLNPLQWSGEVREVIASFWVLCCVGLLIYTLANRSAKD